MGFFTIAKGMKGWVICSIILALATLYFYTRLGYLFSLIAIFLLIFSRDPERKPPIEKGIIVAPADGRFLNGRVFLVEKVTKNEFDFIESEGIRISICMSLFDVHVQRVPVSGKVLKIERVSGKHQAIIERGSGSQNERVLTLIETKYGFKIGVAQIAGILARRIITYIEEGEEVKIGDRLGMIKFGSRVDVILPVREGLQILIRENDSAIAGETVVARYRTN